jgi:hypothetical protein
MCFVVLFCERWRKPGGMMARRVTEVRKLLGGDAVVLLSFFEFRDEQWG